MAKRKNRVPGTFAAAAAKDVDSYKITRKVPDPILARTAKPVTNWDRKVRDIGMRMRMIVLRDAKSVGLSAPQIGVSLRMVAWKDPHGNVQVLCNPTIVHHSDEIDLMEEGCFSVEGKVVESIPRHHSIVVEATDLAGAPVKLPLHGFPARILQHEIDHLDGKTILDHGDPISLAEWEQKREEAPVFGAEG